MDRDVGYSARNKSPEEMFEAGLRDLVQRHLAWAKPPLRKIMVKALQAQIDKLQQPSPAT